jgi:hypothetical protein
MRLSQRHDHSGVSVLEARQDVLARLLTMVEDDELDPPHRQPAAGLADGGARKEDV